jgi:GAF domain-containing protein
VRPPLEADTLYSIVEVIASEPDLDRLLGGVVALLTEATNCHACFVYLRHGDRLRLRAASSVFAHLVGRVELGLDEGLVGWTARTKTPAFIREDALNDPRFSYVPEIHEERFQSMATVPIPARSGATLGVVVLHTQAPREFGESVPVFLQHAASLLAGAIENAGLLEDARRRVDALTALTALGQRIAAVTERERLYRVVTEGVRSLLACASSSLEIARAGRDLGVVATDPPNAPVADGDTVTISAAIMAGDRRLGTLVAADDREFSGDEDELLRTVASQVALALERADLIEHLTSHSLVRQVFDALAADDEGLARARARSAGFDLDLPHIVVEAGLPPGDLRPWPEAAAAIEAGLLEIAAGARSDAGPRTLRALVPAGGDQAALHAALEALGGELRSAIGASDVRRGPGGSAALDEAHDACEIVYLLTPDGGARTYESLGAYRYLVRLPEGGRPRDRHTRAVAALAAYDERRHTSLVATLEEYLHHGRAPVATARALFIHPNTLRQRLARIEELTELDLAREDMLALELAVKLARLTG